MCNRYGYLAPVSRLVEEFSQVRLPILFDGGAVPNLAPRDHIRPTDQAPILRPLDPAVPAAGLELVEARWWLIPFFHRKGIKDWKPMCTNARSETVAATAAYREAFQRRRCLVPATHFFEWTGPKGAKTMWRFAPTRGGIFCFPGLWERAHTTDGVVESFTLLTCAPGADCAPYHDRQPVILGPDAWAAWLDLDADPIPLLRAGEAGAIAVERAVEAA